MRDVWGETFAGAEGYLNTATYGLPSRRQLESQRAALRAWELGEFVPNSLEPLIHEARAAFASLAGVDVSTVAMGATVAQFVGLIAATVPDGSRIGVLTGEFSSVTGPFVAQEPRGVTVTALAPGEFERRAGEFDLVAASVVQSADGRILDLASLRASLADGPGSGRRTTVVLDATQAMGWLPLELGWADAVLATTYKWLLSPRGVAWLSVSERLAARLVPHSANWYAGDRPWENTYALPIDLAPDARRFDTSPTWFAALGASVAMPWLASLDRHEVHAHCVGLADRVRASCGMAATGSAIIAIDQPGAGEAATTAELKTATRAGRTRVAFHLYNTEADAERLIAALSSARVSHSGATSDEETP